MAELRFLIKKIYYRKVLNSQFQWTYEFIVELVNSFTGRGTASQGETLSIFEDLKVKQNITQLLKDINKSIRVKNSFDQIEFDNFLKTCEPRLGKNNTLALSLAFLNAASASLGECRYELLHNIYGTHKKSAQKPPIILCNVLNGGFHAYTNPVLSDFHEFLLIPQFRNLEKLVASFHRINKVVKENLHRLPRVSIAGNLVYCYRIKDNRVWIELLLKVLEKLNLSDDFRLMIDASAGDLSFQNQYNLSITEHKKYSPEKLFRYWEDLLKVYPIQILEDPFSEEDLGTWARLNKLFPDRLIAGDNLFATDPAKIREGYKQKLASAVLIKPNQIGTISGTVEAIMSTFGAKMVPITSHRSIETESTILSDLTFAFDIPIAKLGLFSDFETIIKINQLIRLYEYKKS